jgi:hypothetical protein
MLLEFLKTNRELALEIDFNEVPNYAAEHIRVNGSILSNTWATRHVLAENWNQVDIAYDYYRDTTGLNYHYKNIEQLHVFCVEQFAEIAWSKVDHSFDNVPLSKEELDNAIQFLKYS